MTKSTNTKSAQTAWIITGPTAGIGRRTALELAKHGTVVLVGRSRARLDAVEHEIQAQGGHAVSVVSDLSDVTSARHAAAAIAALDLPIGGLLNNAGIMSPHPLQSAQGWNGVFATDHLGPFALTEALIPYLPDGANVVFIVSAVEDPERKPAVASGFRGARYLSAAASARGEWAPAAQRIPALTPTPPRSRETLPPCSRSRASSRGSTSPPWNPVSTPGRTSDATLPCRSACWGST